MTLNLHEDTKMVLTLAAAKAEQLNHPVIDTEHILLILLNTQGDLFESYSLDIKQARFKLIRYLEQYETSPEFPVYEHGQTQRAFILICIAEMLAGLLQEENVLPDHLLAAISTETKSLAQQILSEGKIYTTRMLNELLLARQLPVTVDYFENFAIQVRNLLIFNLGICSTWQETERLLSVWNKILLNTELKSEFEDFHEVFLRQDMPEHAQRLHQTFSAILLHLELHISMTQAFQLCTENPQININEIVATVEELLTAATVNVRYSILKNKFSILQTHLAIAK